MPAFRLERVLRVRRLLREEARDAVARERAGLVAVRATRTGLRTAVDETRAAEVDAAAVGTTGAVLAAFRTYQRGLRLRDCALAAEETHRTDELVRRRETLVARRRDERQLELLRARFVERAQAAEERAAAVVLDELMLRRRNERR